MKLEQIFDMWEVDCKIDDSSNSTFSQALLSVLDLNRKYLKLLSTEKLKLSQLKENYKSLKADKSQFYLEGPTPETHKMGWRLPPKGKIIIKKDLEIVLEQDKDISETKLIIEEQEIKIEVLTEILDQTKKMNWTLRNIIDYKKYLSGS